MHITFHGFIGGLKPAEDRIGALKICPKKLYKFKSKGKNEYKRYNISLEYQKKKERGNLAEKLK